MPETTPATIAYLEQEIARLCTLVGISVDAPRHVVRIGDIKPRTALDWTYAKGLYVFSCGEDVLYVGRALGSGMGERVRSHLGTGSAEWQAALTRDDCRVRLYVFAPDDVFWSASFEARLIEMLNPPFNDRIS